MFLYSDVSVGVVHVLGACSHRAQYDVVFIPQLVIHLCRSFLFVLAALIVFVVLIVFCFCCSFCSCCFRCSCCCLVVVGCGWLWLVVAVVVVVVIVIVVC